MKDQQRDAAGKANNQPVPGVSVTVLDASGAEIATAVTDDKGVALVPVPGKADYTVKVDESTLPDGLALSAETPAEATVTGDSFTTNKKIVNFFTGESQRVESDGFEKVAQRFADGFRLGLVIAMCSVGLSLIFGTTGLTNFAHGEMVTFGAMVAYLFNDLGLHILIAAPIAVVAGGMFGCALNDFGFAQLRKRGDRPDLADGDHARPVDRPQERRSSGRFGGRDKPYLELHQPGRREDRPDHDHAPRPDRHDPRRRSCSSRWR